MSLLQKKSLRNKDLGNIRHTEATDSPSEAEEDKEDFREEVQDVKDTWHQ